MIINKKILKYFKRDMRLLSSRFFYSTFVKSIRVKAPNNKGRMVYHYPCVSCGELFLPEDKQVQIDHKEAVGELEYQDIGHGLIRVDIEWLNRLFCDFSNLQPLCNLCHNDKTLQDMESMKDISKRKRKFNELTNLEDLL